MDTTATSGLNLDKDPALDRELIKFAESFAPVINNWVYMGSSETGTIISYLNRISLLRKILLGGIEELTPYEKSVFVSYKERLEQVLSETGTDLPVYLEILNRALAQPATRLLAANLIMLGSNNFTSVLLRMPRERAIQVIDKIYIIEKWNIETAFSGLEDKSIRISLYSDEPQVWADYIDFAYYLATEGETRTFLKLLDNDADVNVALKSGGWDVHMGLLPHIPAYRMFELTKTIVTKLTRIKKFFLVHGDLKEALFGTRAYSVEEINNLCDLILWLAEQDKLDVFINYTKLPKGEKRTADLGSIERLDASGSTPFTNEDKLRFMSEAISSAPRMSHLIRPTSKKQLNYSKDLLEFYTLNKYVFEPYLPRIIDFLSRDSTLDVSLNMWAKAYAYALSLDVSRISADMVALLLATIHSPTPTPTPIPSQTPKHSAADIFPARMPRLLQQEIPISQDNFQEFIDHYKNTLAQRAELVDGLDISILKKVLSKPFGYKSLSPEAFDRVTYIVRLIGNDSEKYDLPKLVNAAILGKEVLLKIEDLEPYIAKLAPTTEKEFESILGVSKHDIYNLEERVIWSADLAPRLTKIKNSLHIITGQRIITSRRLGNLVVDILQLGLDDRLNNVALWIESLTGTSNGIELSKLIRGLNIPLDIREITFYSEVMEILSQSQIDRVLPIVRACQTYIGAFPSADILRRLLSVDPNSASSVVNIFTSVMSMNSIEPLQASQSDYEEELSDQNLDLKYIGSIWRRLGLGLDDQFTISMLPVNSIKKLAAFLRDYHRELLRLPDEQRRGLIASFYKSDNSLDILHEVDVYPTKNNRQSVLIAMISMSQMVSLSPEQRLKFIEFISLHGTVISVLSSAEVTVLAESFNIDIKIIERNISFLNKCKEDLGDSTDAPQIIKLILKSFDDISSIIGPARDNLSTTLVKYVEGLSMLSAAEFRKFIRVFNVDSDILANGLVFLERVYNSYEETKDRYVFSEAIKRFEVIARKKGENDIDICFKLIKAIRTSGSVLPLLDDFLTEETEIDINAVNEYIALQEDIASSNSEDLVFLNSRGNLMSSVMSVTGKSLLESISAVREVLKIFKNSLGVPPVFLYFYAYFKLGTTRKAIATYSKELTAPEQEDKIILFDLMKSFLLSGERKILNLVSFISRLPDDLMNDMESDENRYFLHLIGSLIEILDQIKQDDEPSLLPTLKRIKELNRDEMVAFKQDLFKAAFGVFEQIGINSAEELLVYIDNKNTEADDRNRKLEAAWTTGGFALGEGWLTKGVPPGYFEIFLKHGITAPEFLGAAEAGSNMTPKDVDTTMLTSDVTLNNILAINSRYGDLILLIPPESYRLPDKESGLEYERLHLIHTPVVSDSHYGIRNAMDIGNVAGLLLKDSAAAGQLNIIKQLLVSANRYIPVLNEKQQIVFSYKDFLALKAQNEPKVSTVNLNSDIKQRIDTNTKARIAVNQSIRSALTKLFNTRGLSAEIFDDRKLLTSADQVVLLNTGSSGRGTQLPGESDHDFVCNMSKVNIQLMQANIAELVSHIDPEAVVTDTFNRKGGEFQCKIDSPLFGDIDLMFSNYSTKLDKSTGEYLQAQYERVQIEQGQEAFESVIANVVAAKKLLGKLYKKAEGGITGVGVELWILQNEGNLNKAIESFLDVAYDQTGKLIPLADFKAAYPLVDPAQNMLGLGHDDYIQLLSEPTYMAITEKLKNSRGGGGDMVIDLYLSD